MIRNITFTQAPEEAAAPVESPVEQTTLRLRPVTVSPAEEYQLRTGTVRPISDELASAILSCKGRAEITLKGVVIDRKDIGGRYTYFHEDSIVINDLSARERKIYYVLNRQQPDIIHLLTDEGAYIESLPVRERPAVLDADAQAREVARNKTVISRASRRLQDLHGEDTRQRIADLQANSREMQRVVHTLPAPCDAAAQPVQPHRSTHGEAVAAGANRIHAERTNRASSIALGKAIAANRREPVDLHADESDAEDWSDSPRHTSPVTQPTTEIESW